MKHVDEYRDRELCRRLVEEIGRTVTRPHTIMEVCGGQTHGLLANGIDTQLAGMVELIHGPGCPVCVTPIAEIDFAVALSQLPGVIVTSFGDMMRVPGSRRSLREAQAHGGDVRLMYSPLDAVQLAQRQPDREIVFLAVGFETTAPATALAVQQAAGLGLTNFSLISSHVCVLPGMEAMMAADSGHIAGFLAAGHVCTVTGYERYESFSSRYRVPVVVTGFEPADLLQGILGCVQQIERGSARVENCYARCARAEGNPRAVQIVNEVFEPCDRAWRGMAVIRGGGLRLRDRWRDFDAGEKWSLHREPLPAAPATRCRSGEVLTGLIRPTACECFGRECTPESPLGAPMVSAEGACAAYFQFHRTGSQTELK